MHRSPPQDPAGVFFCRNRMDNRHRMPLESREAMTDRRPLLRAIFDAAVAAAHPDVVLSAHLRPVPKGRIICVAAGKGAAAMGAAAARDYLVALETGPEGRLGGVATPPTPGGRPRP